MERSSAAVAAPSSELLLCEDEETTSPHHSRKRANADDTEVQPKRALDDTEAQSKRRRNVRFSSVSVYEHDPLLAADRVPSEGTTPGIALGQLSDVSIRRVDSFDAIRQQQRRGVRHIDGEERARVLLAISRCDSIEHVEKELALTRQQRHETALDGEERAPEEESCERAPPSEGERSPLSRKTPLSFDISSPIRAATPDGTAATLFSINPTSSAQDVGISDLFW